MNKHTNIALLALALTAACGGESATPAPDPTAAPTPPTGTAPEVPAAAANPTTLTLGAPAVTVHTTAAPRFSFTLTAPGEYQIDAMGAPADAQLTITPAEGWLSWSDSDSGEGTDARVQSFFAPGTYEVRVHEWRHNAASVRVSLTALSPMTPVATIAPGAPATTVVGLEADNARGASVEVALTVAAAGSHTITVSTTPDPSAVIQCSPEITVIQNNAVVGSVITTPTGTTTASEARDLAAGTATLRIRNWWNHACTMSLTVAGPS